MNLSVGVALITHTAKRHLPFCLPPLLASSQPHRLLLVNSSSGDGTVELAKEMGVEVLEIPRSEYNHGLTRERARRHLDSDVIVFMTPDAYPIDTHLLTHLIAPLEAGHASIAYARQIPRPESSLFESFARLFNYPETSHLRSLEQASLYGSYLFFCSNACAAYLNRAVDEVGGFPETLFGEDTLMAALLMRRGHKIAYQAEAIVEHSHNYTLLEEFHRHFDIGLFRKKNQRLLFTEESPMKRGSDYGKALLKQSLAISLPSLAQAFLHLAAKGFGYHLGRLCWRAPLWIKRWGSSQKFYWKKESDF